jgi:hypothetical protein
VDGSHLYRVLADGLVVLHLGFAVFVAAGGFLALRWPSVVWLHLPAAAWGVIIELTGWICPLTPLEQAWRIRAGSAAYEGDFVARYVAPFLYPTGFSRDAQVVLGLAVLALIVAVYTRILRRWHPRGGRRSVA